MNNKLSDLNNYLFSQMERLDNEEMDDDTLDREIKRASAISNIAGQIINNANTTLKAVRLGCEYGKTAYVSGLIGEIDEK